MNPVIKTEWLTRLRSKDYKQGTKGHLCTIDKGGNKEYCCLGVLSVIAVEHGVIGDYETYYNNNLDDFHECTEECISHYSHLIFGGESEYLSKEVAEWAGLPADHDGVQRELAIMNDGDPTTDDGDPATNDSSKNSKSFAEIADFIEENL